MEYNLSFFKEENIVRMVIQEKFEEKILFFQKAQYSLLQLPPVENFLQDKNLLK